jgi:hypothetical protein
LLDSFIALLEKEKFSQPGRPFFFKISNIKFRAIAKSFTRKGLNATKINKELVNISKDCAPPHHTITRWVVEFSEPEHDFEDAPYGGRLSTTTIGERAEAAGSVGMRDRQVSVRRVADELGISKNRVHEIISQHCGVSKVCTGWVLKWPTLLQCVSRVGHCMSCCTKPKRT